MATFGEKFKKARLSNKHTQEQAATTIGLCNRQTISKIERDEFVLPNDWVASFDHYMGMKTKIVQQDSVSNNNKKPALIQRLWAYDRKTKQDQVVGYMVADTIDSQKPGFYSIGISACNSRDKFNSKRGREIATARVQRINTTRFIKDRKNKAGLTLQDQYNIFQALRCDQYFKDHLFHSQTIIFE